MKSVSPSSNEQHNATLTISPDGHFIGLTASLCLATFTEFQQRYPNYIMNFVSRMAVDQTTERKVEIAAELAHYLITLPEGSSVSSPKN